VQLEQLHEQHVRLIAKRAVLLVVLAACGEGGESALDASATDAATVDGAVSDGAVSDGSVDAVPTDAAPASACAQLHAQNPSAPSGAYGTPPSYYCDMRGPVVEYDELATGLYSGAYPAYSIISGTSLQDTVVQAAYIWLFNHQGGMIAIDTWTIGNVCMGTSADGTQRLALGATNVALAEVSGQFFAHDIVQGTRYVLHTGSPNDPPLAADFFTTNPPSDTSVCGADNNAAMFFVRR
jgi:hypothetical protein